MTTNPNDKTGFPNNGAVSHDYSEASDSKITSTDEDKAKLKALSEALGVTQQREELDKLNTSVTYLAEKMGQMATILDNQSKILNNLNPNATPQNDNMDKFTMIGNLIEKSGPLLDKLFPKSDSPALIDNETIHKKMRDTFFDNLDTGESINKFIKDSLKKRVTKDIINTSLADIGKSNIVEHGPA